MHTRYSNLTQEEFTNMVRQLRDTFFLGDRPDTGEGEFLQEVVNRLEPTAAPAENPDQLNLFQ